MKIRVRYAHLEFDEVELDIDYTGDIDDIDQDEVLELLEKQVGLGEDNEPEVVNIEGVTTVAERLEYLRGEIRAERISMGELIELQGLAEYIGPGDVELLEPAGVPEFPETRSFEVQISVALTVDAKSAGGAVRQVKAMDAAELFARGTVIEEQGYEVDEDGNHI